MKIQDLSKRVNELITMGSNALSTRHGSRYEGGESLDPGAIKGFRSASLSFIDRIYGSSHPHYTEFDKCTNGYTPSRAEEGIAILKAILSEIEGGWLFSVKGLVAAELFADFIEMAEHLLEKGYKDPAAVMVGSVLEEHLRQLCIKHDIPTEEEKDDKIYPKRADRMNTDLTKAEIYSKLDQKTITSWLDLRNKAAHGKYIEYNEQQVQHMISGITEFMSRVAV